MVCEIMASLKTKHAIIVLTIPIRLGCEGTIMAYCKPGTCEVTYKFYRNSHQQKKIHESVLPVFIKVKKE